MTGCQIGTPASSASQMLRRAAPWIRLPSRRRPSRARSRRRSARCDDGFVRIVIHPDKSLHTTNVKQPAAGSAGPRNNGEPIRPTAGVPHQRGEIGRIQAGRRDVHNNCGRTRNHRQRILEPGLQPTTHIIADSHHPHRPAKPTLELKTTIRVHSPPPFSGTRRALSPTAALGTTARC